MAAASGGVTQELLHSLVETMSKTAYRAKDTTLSDEKILCQVLELCGRDYKYSVINNDGGELCNHYPSKLIMFEYESKENCHDMEPMYNIAQMKELFSKARLARCRTRFVLPVILIDGKHICRSATISSGGEMYGRIGLNMVFNNSAPSPSGKSMRYNKSSESFSRDANSTEDSELDGDSQTFDRIRGQDIKLLKQLNVQHICDLMLEAKKVKYFMNVTSSEKVDKLNRYADFNVWSLPYPGCEFFKIWKDNNYNAEKLVFDWKQEFVNAELELPDEPHLRNLDIPWNFYKSWNLIQITQHYLMTMLKHVQDGETGLLVHCISGWDRTPLFISLLRISLWADGLIHKSLSALEILYLTVGYDWYMFGHNLPDRISKGEEIFFFCFYFLKYIQEDCFVVKSRHHSHSLCSEASPMSSHHDTPPDVSMAASTSAERLPEIISLDFTNSGHSSANGGAGVPVPSVSAHRVRPSSSETGDQRSGSPLPHVGSWQVIADTGSFMGSSSPYYRPSERRRSSSGEARSISRNSISFTDLPEHDPSPRRKRLEEVRALFYHAYNKTVGFKAYEENSGGFSSLVNAFANKLVSKLT